MRIFILLFGLLIFCVLRQTHGDVRESPRAVQIISPFNHTNQLDLTSLKKILDVDELKDRNVVVVSIAGAFRKGKSFLLNFFLAYLDAKYRKHDVSNWMNESHGFGQNGFKARGGPERETTGIWMWSDVFTHDYPNGDKVAIIVLDTQGTFDDESSTKEWIATFGTSMMLSSVQCYNVMQNIQEDDLQNLDLFTDYGRLAMEQTNEKPFQNLLFIVRDWPNPAKYNFGNGQEFIDKKLSANEKQTTEMHQMRDRIRNSFTNISAFLMPHPGLAVAEGMSDIGNLTEIDLRFQKYVQILVPMLFAPENLVVKKINGQNVRTQDVATYLQKYVDIFNSDKLPKAGSVLMATAEVNNQILYGECLQLYTETMQERFDEVATSKIRPFFTSSELRDVHEKAKDASISKFQNLRKLGGPEMISRFQHKLESEIKAKYMALKKMNIDRRKDFNAATEAKMKLLYMQCLAVYDDAMRNLINQAIGDRPMNLTELRAAHEERKKRALTQFQDGSEQGDNESVDRLLIELTEDIDRKFTDIELNMKEKQKMYDEKQMISDEIRKMEDEKKGMDYKVKSRSKKNGEEDDDDDDESNPNLKYTAIGGILGGVAGYMVFGGPIGILSGAALGAIGLETIAEIIQEE